MLIENSNAGRKMTINQRRKDTFIFANNSHAHNRSAECVLQDNTFAHFETANPRLMGKLFL